MANRYNDHGPCCNGENKIIERITLPDGRRAERHVFVDESDNEVVEVFAEESRPLKLEERILRERKKIVSKETHEIIKDGEVSHVEVRSLEPDVPLQIRERIGVADHAKIVDGDYVRKDELAKIVADSVVAGIGAMMENMDDTQNKEIKQPEYFNAQNVVEKNVAEKKKKDSTVNVILAVVLIAQMAFFGYMLFVM